MGGVRVSVYRGHLPESWHRGHVVVAGPEGGLRVAGAQGLVTYLRSAAKPLQAVAILEAGVAREIRPELAEVAVMSASHNGEELHRRTVAALLSRLDLSEADLHTGTHPPFGAAERQRLRSLGLEPGPLHSNCSGKHAGMLALARVLGVSLADYYEPEHPVQRRLRETVAELAGLKAADLVVGVDGCGVPVFGLPLSHMARAYARLADPRGLNPERQQAIETVWTAMTKHPELVAGEGRLDTALLETGGGVLLAKTGAEGVYAVANRRTGEGLALKIEDGSERAIAPAVMVVLADLGWLTPEQVSNLAAFGRPMVRNHHGQEIGHLEAEVHWES